MKSYSDRKILHTHLLIKGFMPHYIVWTKLGERGVMMENNEEEEDDDNYVPLEYGDAAAGEVEDQEEPDDVSDIFTGSLLMQRDSAKVKMRSWSLIAC